MLDPNPAAQYDPAFRWCRLLILVLQFSTIKFGVCPEKVGKMTFSGAVNSTAKLTCIVLVELKGY